MQSSTPTGQRGQPRNKMTATTTFPNRFLNKTQQAGNKLHWAWARTVRAKNRQVALDNEGSFREGDTRRLQAGVRRFRCFLAANSEEVRAPKVVWFNTDYCICHTVRALTG